MGFSKGGIHWKGYSVNNGVVCGGEEWALRERGSLVEAFQGAGGHLWRVWGLFDGVAYRKRGKFWMWWSSRIEGSTRSSHLWRGLFDEKGPLPKSNSPSSQRSPFPIIALLPKTTNLDEILSPNSPFPQILSFPYYRLHETVLGWCPLWRVLSRSGLFEGRAHWGLLG